MQRSTSPTTAPPSPHRRGRRSSRSLERGFTLVELLVALMAGLFVSLAAFMLARSASKFFQNEARASAAQDPGMMGMNRLQADVQRAAFMTLPNVNNPDLKLSGNKTGWTAGMKELAGITIEQNGSRARHGDTVHALSLVNGLDPDSLILSGSFHSSELFAARTIIDDGSTTQIYLQTDDGPMARTQAAAACGGLGLDEIFVKGRYIRIVDPLGYSSYGIIFSLTGNPTTPVVTLEDTPALPERSSEAHSGYSGLAIGYSVNVVSRILYDVRSVDDSTKYPQYQALYAKGSHDANTYHRGVAIPARTELVRVELDENDVEIDNTLEVVAEYTVDFKLGITREVLPRTSPPTFVRVPIGDTDVSKYGRSITDAAPGTPESIRALLIRLSTRSAEVDRDYAIGASSTGGLYRYDLNLGTDLAGNRKGFARMRTIVTEVALPNNRLP